MALIIDDINPELLGDKPTLFAKRLREFLNDEQIWQVIVAVSEVCNRCWDSEQPCDCVNNE